MPSNFSDFSIFVIFFVYGLAFFSMGLALFIEARRVPYLDEARLLLPLAVFGFIHGIHEWVDMVLLQRALVEITHPDQVAWLRIGLLTLSFFCLQIFVLRIFLPQLERFWHALLAGLAVLLMILAIWVSQVWQPVVADWMPRVDGLIRYALAIPGALTAAIAMRRQARKAYSQKLGSLAAGWRIAAYSFAGYAFTQSVVPPSDLWPASIWNTSVFIDLFGFPVQGLRAALAVVLTLGLIHAIQAMEAERQKEFLAAQKARLEALEQMQAEVRARAIINKNLLHYTVAAQEEERARIARELHDETAQLLTAISLNLATLRSQPLHGKDNQKLLERLQELSRQMSHGIYRLVHDLRPAQLDDLGLVAALRYLADETKQRLNLAVVVNVFGSQQRLDRLVETVFFRVAQEALTNVARHAQVQEALVNLIYEEQQVILQVIDRGTGFDLLASKPEDGWGLAGMRERADSIDGVLKVISSPNSGTMVELTVPSVVADDSKQEACNGGSDPFSIGG
jgi:signal transduction histidine kinase